MGPLFVLTGRIVLIILARASVGGIYLLRHHPSPWRAAAPGGRSRARCGHGCLELMAWFMRGEQIGWCDLIGRVYLRWVRDILPRICWLGLVVPVFYLRGQDGQQVGVWLAPGPSSTPGLWAGGLLPLRAVFDSLSIWWIIWSPGRRDDLPGLRPTAIHTLAQHPRLAIVLEALW